MKEGRAFSGGRWGSCRSCSCRTSTLGHGAPPRRCWSAPLAGPAARSLRLPYTLALKPRALRRRDGGEGTSSIQDGDDDCGDAAAMCCCRGGTRSSGLAVDGGVACSGGVRCRGGVGVGLGCGDGRLRAGGVADGLCCACARAWCCCSRCCCCCCCCQVAFDWAAWGRGCSCCSCCITGVATFCCCPAFGACGCGCGCRCAACLEGAAFSWCGVVFGTGL